MNHAWRLFVALAAGLAATTAVAQTRPDAGQSLKDLAPTLVPPKVPPDVKVEGPATETPGPGGIAVKLEAIRFHGNSVFTAEQLAGELAGAIGRPQDLAGLRGLAGRITTFYRRAGYPFARAYLPPQSLQDGTLRIEIIEGRYGRVEAQGDAKLLAGAKAFLAALHPGDVIEGHSLERATLVLFDQPGIQVSPLIRPGQESGTGDLLVNVTERDRVGGDAGIDNDGNRYTGTTRLRLDLEVNGSLAFGDQIAIRSLYTGRDMWFGSLGYGLPLGGSGLRAQAAYSHTYYALGSDFAALHASGTANVTSLGFSYPVLRSRDGNLSVSGNLQHKGLLDRQGGVGTDKSSNSIPLALTFDRRDLLGGSGVSYGSFTWTSGNAKFDPTQRATDATTARAEGVFHKAVFDLAHVQALPQSFAAYGRMAGQWASRNLESSERFGLGGANGVRAYPIDEGYGDEGLLAQAELRYSIGDFRPCVFYDEGWAKDHAHPWDQSANRRAIAGGGLGLHYQHEQWTAEAMLAWRTIGGAPQSDTIDHRPRIWVTAGRRF